MGTYRIIKIENIRFKDIVGELSDEEIEAITREIVERIKDITYTSLEHKVHKAIEELIDTNPYTDDIITFEWKLELTASDLIQMIGRIRRKQSEEAKSL